MHRCLALLHTAESHVDSFDQQLLEIRTETGALFETCHFVHPELLTRAIDSGINDDLRQSVRQTLNEIFDQGCDMVVCTCSTIGGLVEAENPRSKQRAIRIDRQMAHDAVNYGRVILVVAAVASTLGPTSDLLYEEARHQGQSIIVRELLCESAWGYFLDGDILEGENGNYIDSICANIYNYTEAVDVVVLAQASMSPVEYRLQTEVPVLSSPRRGLLSAINTLEGSSPAL